MIKSIVFWDLYNGGMGGIERLIITLTEELSKYIEVKLIAKKEGIVYKTLKENKIKFTFIDYSNEILYTKVTTNDLLLTFGTYTEFIKLSKSNPFICIWRVYPSLCMKKKVQRLLMKQTLKYLSNTSSLYFMDNTTWNTACWELGVSFPKRIITIPIKARHVEEIYKNPKGQTIHVTYIGRGNEIWKIKPVKKFINDAKELTKHYFKLTIFTNTKDLFIKELGSIPKNIEIEYLLGVFDKKLSQELINRSNLHFSMGTSALEGAILGIPTLIVDASFDDFPNDYKYRWIIDDLENYAGTFINENRRNQGFTLNEIIEQIMDTDKAINLSSHTKSIISNNFSTLSIGKKILSIKPEAKLSTVIKYMPSYWRQILNNKDSYKS